MTPQNRTAAVLAGVVALMLSLSFAAVPFYSWFCKVTGYGGTTGVAEAAPGPVLDQTITIRFDANQDPNLPWTFRPVVNQMKVQIGQTALAYFEASNPSIRTIAGQASYNVSPDLAGQYFIKIECFCFTEQVLQPGETVLMPVSFFVDPAMVADSEMAQLQEITLSYTMFHEIPLPQAQAALATEPQPAIN